jgi:hypothetical protein
VLDHVEAGRFEELPAREHLAPFAVGAGIADQNLHEGTRLAREFPWRGALARLEADDDVPHPARFSGFHLEVLRQVVALVEQADDGDPLGHRRGPFVRGHGADRPRLPQVFRDVGLDRARRRRSLILARGKGQQRQQKSGSATQRRSEHRQEPGLHAS